MSNPINPETRPGMSSVSSDVVDMLIGMTDRILVRAGFELDALPSPTAEFRITRPGKSLIWEFIRSRQE